MKKQIFAGLMMAATVLFAVSCNEKEKVKPTDASFPADTKWEARFSRVYTDGDTNENGEFVTYVYTFNVKATQAFAATGDSAHFTLDMEGLLDGEISFGGQTFINGTYTYDRASLTAKMANLTFTVADPEDEDSPQWDPETEQLIRELVFRYDSVQDAMILDVPQVWQEDFDTTTLTMDRK